MMPKSSHISYICQINSTWQQMLAPWLAPTVARVGFRHFTPHIKTPPAIMVATDCICSLWDPCRGDCQYTGNGAGGPCDTENQWQIMYFTSTKRKLYCAHLPHGTLSSSQKLRWKLDSNQSSHGIIRWLLRPTDPSAGTVSELAPGMEGMAKSHHT